MQASFYEKTTKSANVKCLLCPRNCVILPDKTGFCRIRANYGGTLTLPFYGYLSSIALDPIEKKPLRRFHPGKKILSVGGYSCNMRCPWCQNHEITMSKPVMRFYHPEEIVRLALELKPEGNIGIAYTYNEPFIHYEYLRDCAALAYDAGLKNVVVTNGFINPAPLDEILPLIHALNIDVKGFTEDFYKDISGSLNNVLNTVSAAARVCHTEITMLTIPGLNDDNDTIINLSKHIAQIDNEIALHITRFYPRFKMTDKSGADYATVSRLKQAADLYLKYVYI